MSIGLLRPLFAELPRFLDSVVDRAQRIVGSAAPVLGSILVAALFRFGGFGSDSCDLGLAIGFMKIIE